jgi:hypothetical protein
MKKRYQYILDGAVTKDGSMLFGFRIREGVGFGNEKIQDILNHCLDKGMTKILVEIAPEWKGEQSPKHRRVLVSGLIEEENSNGKG